jgi:16S rRNA (guanine(966)-N(2))-methyltransferase RsmD
MRIITGSAKGTKLKTPRDRLIRPTADKVKGSVFNVLGPKVVGANVLDLFGGTGNLGLEALSRGANSAVFVDQSETSIGLIKNNAASTKLADRVTIYRGEVLRTLDKFMATGKKFDLIFCDPPYNKGLVTAVLAKIDQSTLLTSGGTIIMEHSRHEPAAAVWNILTVDRTLRYGETMISFISGLEH